MAGSITSPCVGLCSTTLGDPVCRGCQRGDDEILEWFGLSGDQRAARMAELDALRESVAGRFLKVIDADCLEAQLRRYRIRFRPEQPALSRAVELLRVGRTRIQALRRYGLEPSEAALGLDVAELHARLSQALNEAAERRTLETSDAPPSYRLRHTPVHAMPETLAETVPRTMPRTMPETMPEIAEVPSDESLLPPDLLDFLNCATPDGWIAWALENPELLLIDHAQCEKKAASTAMSLLYRYVNEPLLLTKMSQLAREELLHFEQVVKLMESRGIVYRHLSASRYAEGLRQHIDAQEPARLVDILIIGAFIEARSCERFARLIPHLDLELAKFYRTLVKSEGRHYEDYLMLARHLAPGPIDDRVAFFAEREAELIVTPDKAFRFHSGVPG